MMLQTAVDCGWSDFGCLIRPETPVLGLPTLRTQFLVGLRAHEMTNAIPWNWSAGLREYGSLGGKGAIPLLHYSITQQHLDLRYQSANSALGGDVTTRTDFAGRFLAPGAVEGRKRPKKAPSTEGEKS